LYIIVFYLSYFLFGFFGFITAKKLTNYDIEKVKEGGISHFTTIAGYKGITEKSIINASKFRKAYSNHFKKCVFLFANEYINEDAYKFNFNIKYSWKINISNLSENQIEKLKIRDYDKALMYQGNLFLEKENNITWTELESSKLRRIEKIRYMIKVMLTSKFDNYLICLTGCALFCMAIIYGVPIVIITKFDLLQYWIEIMNGH
jgi:hypothetical protein